MISIPETLSSVLAYFILRSFPAPCLKQTPTYRYRRARPAAPLCGPLSRPPAVSLRRGTLVPPIPRPPATLPAGRHLIWRAHSFHCCCYRITTTAHPPSTTATTIFLSPTIITTSHHSYNHRFTYQPTHTHTHTYTPVISGIPFVPYHTGRERFLRPSGPSSRDPPQRG